MNDFYSTAFFVKHPFRIEDLKVPHRYETRKRFAVVKTIELSKIDYDNFVADLCVDRTFIEENKGLCRINEDGVWLCLLVKQRGRSDGVLVMPDGRDYPKYAAYYPGEEGRAMSARGFPSKETVFRLKEQYPPGTRVELIYMDDPYSKLKPGDQGTVSFVDDIGTVHINWDCGSSLGVAYGIDVIRKL